MQACLSCLYYRGPPHSRNLIFAGDIASELLVILAVSASIVILDQQYCAIVHCSSTNWRSCVRASLSDDVFLVPIVPFACLLHCLEQRACESHFASVEKHPRLRDCQAPGQSYPARCRQLQPLVTGLSLDGRGTGLYLAARCHHADDRRVSAWPCSDCHSWPMNNTVSVGQSRDACDCRPITCCGSFSLAPWLLF